MESSASSIVDLPSIQRSVYCSIAPSISSEFDRPFFIAVCTKVLLISLRYSYFKFHASYFFIITNIHRIKFAQMICEIDPLFYVDHYNELDQQWTLQDVHRNFHQVEFNMSLLIPILTTG